MLAMLSVDLEDPVNSELVTLLLLVTEPVLPLRMTVVANLVACLELVSQSQ